MSLPPRRGKVRACPELVEGMGVKDTPCMSAPDLTAERLKLTVRSAQPSPSVSRPLPVLFLPALSLHRNMRAIRREDCISHNSNDENDQKRVHRSSLTFLNRSS